MEEARKKDTIIPAFLSSLNIPTARVIGYEKGEEFRNKFGFFQVPNGLTLDNGVLLDEVGQTDYSQIVPRLKFTTLVKTGKKIINLMALMHVRATKNLDLLEREYGLDLESTDYDKLINDRLLSHLKTDKKAQEN